MQRYRTTKAVLGPFAPFVPYAAYAMYKYMRRNPKAKTRALTAPFTSVKKPVYKRKPAPARRPRKRAVNNIAQRVAKLERTQVDTMSTLVYRYDIKDTLRPSVGSASYGYKDAVSIAIIELAIAQCRFFDPSAPGTLITGSLATPTFSQKIQVSAYSQCIITNNYQVPCVVTYGLTKPKEDTSITPNQAVSNGLVDVGNPDSSSTLISYRDSPQFRDLWPCKLNSKRLAPGETLKMIHGQKAFTYDPSLFDSETETYQRVARSAVFIYRCQGVLGHDNVVSSEQGMLPAGIDVYVSTTYTIKYNSGGSAIKTIVLNENASQTFTNAGVVSQVAVDNQSYSVS